MVSPSDDFPPDVDPVLAFHDHFEPYDAEGRHAAWFIWGRYKCPPWPLGVTCSRSTCSGPAVGPTLPSGAPECEVHRIESQIQIANFLHRMKGEQPDELDAQRDADAFEIREIDLHNKAEF